MSESFLIIIVAIMVVAIVAIVFGRAIAMRALGASVTIQADKAQGADRGPLPARHEEKNTARSSSGSSSAASV